MNTLGFVALLCTLCSAYAQFGDDDGWWGGDDNWGGYYGLVPYGGWRYGGYPFGYPYRGWYGGWGDDDWDGAVYNPYGGVYRRGGLLGYRNGLFGQRGFGYRGLRRFGGLRGNLGFRRKLY